MSSKPPTPRLWFTDFCNEKNRKIFYEDNCFYRLLNQFYDVNLDADHPEFLIHSVFGCNRYCYTCVRIAMIGENCMPDFQWSDWAFSQAPTQGRNFYFPHWAWHAQPRDVLACHEAAQAVDIATQKTKFCAFMYSNPHCTARNKFFKCLHARKHVDALGAVFQNVNRSIDRNAADWFERSIKIYKPYKFVIAFENSSAPGYTTEKITATFLANAVPIYWGNPFVTRMFNADTFINAHDFDSLEALADYVLRVDSDPALYNKYLLAPKFRNNQIPYDANWSVLAERFAEIFHAPITPAWKTAPTFERLVLPHLSYRLRRLYAKRLARKYYQGFKTHLELQRYFVGR